MVPCQHTPQTKFALTATVWRMLPTGSVAEEGATIAGQNVSAMGELQGNEQYETLQVRPARIHMLYIWLRLAL